MTSHKDHQEMRDLLKQFVTSEMEQFQRGEISSLTPRSELARRFGYADLGMSHTLSQFGLLETRQLLEEQERLQSVELSQSSDTAWILGVLVGTYVKTTPPIRCSISVGREDEGFLERFIPIAERFFQANANVTTESREQDGKIREHREYRFYNAPLINAIGDLRNQQWARTIKEKHGWIFKNSQHTWSFLQGLFERRGYVDRKGPENNRLRMSFLTRDLEGAIFIMELLAQLGIEKPFIDYNNVDKQSVRGVTVRNVSDLKRLAEHIHSIVPEREQLLDFYRNLDITERRRGRKHSLPSNEDVLAEYERILQLLGHEPSVEDIRRLRKLNATKYSLSIYTRRFGSGSFIRARERLRERLGIGQLPTTTRRDSRQFMRYSSDEIIDEWQRLTQLLGHEPGMNEITELRRKGATKYSHSLYTDRFGDRGGFPKARESIRRILAERADDVQG